MGRELRADGKGDLGEQLAALDLEAGSEGEGRCKDSRVGALLDRALSREGGKSDAKFDESADGDGDGTGLLGCRGAEDEEQGAVERFESREGGSGTVVGERWESERREKMVVGHVCELRDVSWAGNGVTR